MTFDKVLPIAMNTALRRQFERFASRLWGIGVAAMLCPVVGGIGDACAQTSDVTTAADRAHGAAGATQLKSRLSALRRELEQARAESVEAQRRHDEELTTLADERAKLADRLLTLEIERERNAAKLKTLTDESRIAAEAAKRAADDAAALANAVRDAAEQLRLHLREVPGTEKALKRLSAIAAGLAKGDADADRAPELPLVREFLTLCDDAHRDATGVRVTQSEIFTATGEREGVKLLAVGHARFAYQTQNGGRVGLALASAQDAAGYRWTEDLPGDVQTAIREAITACENSPGELISVPFDPTGRMQLDEVNREQSVYEWFVAGGLVMFPLVAVAVGSLLLVVERAACLYIGNPGAGRLVGELLAACRADDLHRAMDACSERRGTVPRVLAACLTRSSISQRAMEDAIQEQLLQELPRLQRFMGSLATLAGVAPLLGLLGTVTGIIQTFTVIRSFGNANPALMAGGISEALITTALGLMIAVPVVILHSILRGRSERVLADAERHAATLLTTLAHRHADGDTSGTRGKRLSVNGQGSRDGNHAPALPANGSRAKDARSNSSTHGPDAVAAKEVRID